MCLSESKEYYKKLLKEFDLHSQGYKKNPDLLKKHQQTALKVYGKLQDIANQNPENVEAANKAARAALVASKFGLSVGKSGSVGNPIQGDGTAPVLFTWPSGGYDPDRTPVGQVNPTGTNMSGVSRLQIKQDEARLRKLSPAGQANRAKTRERIAANIRNTPVTRPMPVMGRTSTATRTTLAGRIMKRLTNRATSGGTPARPVSMN